jgi:hypothetical protein
LSKEQAIALEHPRRRPAPLTVVLDLIGYPSRRWGWNLLLLLLPPVLFGMVVFGATRSHALGFDFRGTLWDPGKAILHGHTPYPPPHPDALRTGNPAVYPPAVMLLFAPLTLLPWSLGLTIWIAASVLAVAAALWLLGVRDWRVYAVAFLGDAFLTGMSYSNLTLLLLLGLAAAWRWRDRPLVAGPLVAALVVAKIFLWPLIVWLAVTRRWRAAVSAVVLTVLVAVASWAVIGFDGFRTYPKLLRALNDVYASHSLSVASLGQALGLGAGGAQALALVLCVGLLAFGALNARRPDGDRLMLTAAVLGSIVATPIVWIYYFLFLLVPLALYRRRLSAAWWWVSAGCWLVVQVQQATADKAPTGRPHDIPKPVWPVLTTKPSIAALVTSALLIGLAGVIMLRRTPLELRRRLAYSR